MAVGDRFPVVMGAEKDIANGVATLDANGILKDIQWPPTVKWQSNKNLLDNWYFVDPINQRGQTEYTGTVYGIDRWKNNTDQTKQAIDAHGLLLQKANDMSTGVRNIYQPIDNFQNLKGKTLTLSVLVYKAVGGRVTTHFSGLNIGSALGAASEKPFLITTSGVVSDSISNLFVHIRVEADTSDNYAIIEAVKLELGSQQTLAHQDASGNWVLNDPPPNKALELAKCQRYMIELASNLSNSSLVGIGKATTSTTCYILCPVPVTLRAAPAVERVGTFKLVNNSDAPYGLDVTSIGYSNYSANGITLLCKSDTPFEVGATYELWKSGDRNAQLILDANL